MICVQCNGGFSPNIIHADTMMLPLGNPIKPHYVRNFVLTASVPT